MCHELYCYSQTFSQFSVKRDVPLLHTENAVPQISFDEMGGKKKKKKKAQSSYSKNGDGFLFAK